MNTASVVLSTLSAALTSALLVWILSLHGTRGLLHVEYVARIGFLAMAILAFVPLALLLVRRHYGRRPGASSRIRIWTVLVSSLAIFITFAGFAYVSGFPQSSQADGNPRLIVAAGTGSHGIPDIAVVVDPAPGIRYTLKWSERESQASTTEAEGPYGNVFMLKGLEPETQYRYSLNGGREYRFTTPSLNSRPLHFAVGSDAHFGSGDSRNDLTAEMLAQIADPARRFDYFFSLGDNVEFGFRPAQWQKARLAFAPTVSAIPSTFVAGNHDTIFTGLGRYLVYGYPKGIELQNGTRLWHRFDVGSVHFIILDVEWSAESFNRQQAAWLEAELQSIPKEDWTIVMNHRFYYGSGNVVRGSKWNDNIETIQRITPLFEKYGVDLVFSGHEHQMELLQNSGVTYVISGAFGGTTDAKPTYTSPASLWYAAGQYGYVDVSVEADVAVIRFKDSHGEDLKVFSLAHQR